MGHLGIVDIPAYYTFLLIDYFICNALVVWIDDET